MKRFELWLDESGDFNNDDQKTARGSNPSLIGGLLVEGSSFNEAAVRSILPEAGTYHSVNESDQLDRFRKIEEKLFENDSNRLVVFSNQERIMILDNNLTYLNIIAEGIHQMIRHLKSQYGRIFLKVLIANRVNTTTGLNFAQSVVPQDEYERRLREKLLILNLENAISDDEWELQTASARKDKRLMLSDIVCNTFYTRYRKKKFNAGERKYIEDIYQDRSRTIVFTVFESILEKNFKNYLMENKIGEAVSEIAACRDKGILDRCFELLGSKLRFRGAYDIKFQYSFISASIERYINVVRDFDLCILYLNNLCTYYIPLLAGLGRAEAAEAARRLELDIKFYLLTVYTNKGDVERARQLEGEIQAAMVLLPASLENINYSIKFESRRITGLINQFEFEKALEASRRLVERCGEVHALLELFYGETADTHYTELAKALGSRLFIENFLVRFRADLRDAAIEDSDAAIREFTDENDKKRQYLYRVQLETELGDFEVALRYLKMGAGLPEQASIKELWAQIDLGQPFLLSAYIRLMAEGSLKGWETAGLLYAQMAGSELMQELGKGEKFFHPMEIIYWKYGTYCAHAGMLNGAVKNYQKAEEICFSTEDVTMNIIGLAIAFEEYAFTLEKDSKQAAQCLKSIKKRMNHLQTESARAILKSLWGEPDLARLDARYFWELSRRVTY